MIFFIPYNFVLIISNKFAVITCETPNVPPGSYVVGYDYNIHSMIEYHCDPGHILRGEKQLRCLETGEWSGEAPFCECKSYPTLKLNLIKAFNVFIL